MGFCDFCRRGITCLGLVTKNGLTVAFGPIPLKQRQGSGYAWSRWNLPGKEAIYTSGSVSLATLEILAHYSVLPKNFVLTAIRIPGRVSVIQPAVGMLPPDWDVLAPEGVTEAQREGSFWLEQYAVLVVPSVIVPWEFNYILSPTHSDFQYIEFLESRIFRFDQRLK